MLSLLILSFAVLLILFKDSFFLILVLIEVVFMLVLCVLLMSSLPLWYILPLISLGASESALGLSTSVSLARVSSPSCFSL